MSMSVHLHPSVHNIHRGLSLHSLTLHTHVQTQSFIKTTDTSNIDSCNVGSDYAFPCPYEWSYQVSDQGPKSPLVYY